MPDRSLDSPPDNTSAALRAAYRFLTLTETIVCYAAFAVGTLALIIDIFGREVLGNGVFGAQRVAVYAMAIAGMMGFSYVITHGGHLRPSVVDKLFPERLHPAMARFADLLSAAMCAGLTYASAIFVASTFRIGERDMSLPLDIWIVQTVLVAAFGYATIKFLIFFAAPSLRPVDQGEAI